MTQEQAIQLFVEKRVRTVWDTDAEKWWSSIVDCVAVLTDSVDPAAYWRKLKQRLKAEGNETVTNCHGLKMQAPNGKMRLAAKQTARVENIIYKKQRRIIIFSYICTFKKDNNLTRKY